MSNQTTWTDDAGGIFNANATTPLPVSANPVPAGATAVGASQTGAATPLSGTLAAGGAAKRTYISGLVVTGAGATAGSVITVTLTNTVGGTMNFKVVVPAGAGTSITPLVVNFIPPVPAGALNQGIAVTVPSFGAGNTDAAFSAWGYNV